MLANFQRLNSLHFGTQTLLKSTSSTFISRPNFQKSFYLNLNSFAVKTPSPFVLSSTRYFCSKKVVKKADKSKSKAKVSKGKRDVKSKKIKVAADHKKERERERERKLKEKQKEKAVKEKEREKERSRREKLQLEKNMEKERKKLEREKEKEKKANRPKRPKSAFIVFVAKNISGLKDKSKATENIRALAKKWKSLSETEKKAYVEEARKDKQRYEKEKAVIAKNAPPKRPQTGFILFSNDVRPQIIKENPELSSNVVEVARKCGERWKKLGQADKDKYIARARKAMEKFKSGEPQQATPVTTKNKETTSNAPAKKESNKKEAPKSSGKKGGK